MTQPKIYENRLFCIPDTAPPIPRHPDDLTLSVAASPSSIPASAVNTLLSEAHPKLPGRSRRRRRRKKKAVAAANENSAPRTADRPTPTTLSANRNPAHWASSKARQPGTRSTSVEHLPSFASSPMTQHPISSANENSDHAYRRDHPERRAVYKKAQTSPSQDLTVTHSRDNNNNNNIR